MATYREVAYSVLQAYKKVHDDTTVEVSQIVFYIQVIVNRLRQENKRDISVSRYLTKFCSIPVEIDKDCKDQMEDIRNIYGKAEESKVRIQGEFYSLDWFYW